jgi:hypothetical protein
MRKGELSRSLTRKDLPILWGVGFVGLVVSTFLCTSDYPVGCGLLLGMMFYPVGVCLHELGHACGATFMGGSIRYIQLGKQFKGKVPWRRRFLGFDWLLYSFPLSGFVVGDFYTTRYYRLRECVFVAAGPFVNLVLLLVGVALSYQVRLESWSAVNVGLILANAIILFYSIPPRNVYLNGGLTPNDGLLFYQTICCKSEDIAKRVAASEMFRRIRAEGAEVRALSLSELLAKHETEPDNFAVLWSLVYRLGKTHDTRYVDFLLILIDNPMLKRDYVPYLLDTYLTRQLDQGPPDRPDVTDRFSSRLLADEDSISTRGTRGAVLIDLGRIAEGRAMLDEVLTKSTSDLDKVYSRVFLALADKHEGDLDAARQHAEAASKLNVPCPARARIADLFAPPI